MRFTSIVVPALVITVLACSDTQAPTSDLARGTAPDLGHVMTPEMVRASSGPEVARLRALVAPFHQLNKAVAGGWDTDLTGCLELPGVGGMGHHYANLGWLFDGAVAWNQPEVLVFAPSPDARDGLKLVAVEYVVFKDAMPAAPSLYGETFHDNPEINAWVLHVWLGDHNPSGLFEDWNPTISCG